MRLSNLKIIKDKEFFDGFCYYDNKNYEVYVNIEKLWKECLKTKNPEKNFFRKFAKTQAHELIHMCIGRAIKTKRSKLGEEKVIYKMLRERCPKSIAEDYKGNYSE